VLFNILASGSAFEHSIDAAQPHAHRTACEAASTGSREPKSQMGVGGTDAEENERRESSNSTGTEIGWNFRVVAWETFRELTEDGAL
jgi:hypothetical protein